MGHMAGLHRHDASDIDMAADARSCVFAHERDARVDAFEPFIDVHEELVAVFREADVASYFLEQGDAEFLFEG